MKIWLFIRFGLIRVKLFNIVFKLILCIITAESALIILAPSFFKPKNIDIFANKPVLMLTCCETVKIEQYKFNIKNWVDETIYMKNYAIKKVRNKSIHTLIK